MHTEYLGYLAIFFIIVAFLFKDVKRIRIWNAVGAATFALYGFLKGAYPVFLGNAMIAGVNIFQLFSLFRKPNHK